MLRLQNRCCPCLKQTPQASSPGRSSSSSSSCGVLLLPPSPAHQLAVAGVLSNGCDFSSVSPECGYVFTRLGAVHPDFVSTGSSNQPAICRVAERPAGDDATLQSHLSSGSSAKRTCTA